MATSSTEYFEVRWRVKDADEAWSDLRRVEPTSEIVIAELDRTLQYEFEVRAVSNCGARSIWVPSDYTVPDVPNGTVTLSDLAAAAADALAAATASEAELLAIASDNILTAGEKPAVIRDVNVITGEQAGLDAQADQYAITTAKDDYDTAVTTLLNYLATLNTPVPWNNTSGNTNLT